LKKLLFILGLFLVTNLFGSKIPTNSVVKIFASVSHFNYKFPWQAPIVYNYTGSGAIIKNKQILTSAHVVGGANFIEVLKEGDPNKYIAKIKYISNQSDLAILEVEKKSFFDGTKPLVLNEKIAHRDPVTVLGYPIGGNSIATTTGVVSRIEYTPYVWSRNNLLAIEIDAAINSGNSGGPVINKKGELIGIAMQTMKNASNIGYIVPAILIETFLKDAKDGKIDGLHFTATTTRTIENPTMKEYYHIKDKGVLVTFVDKDDIELKKEDILLAIDGKPIANDGTIETKLGRVDYEIALHSKQVGESVNLSILRDAKIIKVSYRLKYSAPLIKLELNQEPKYFIFGGLVFAPLTKNFLKAFGKEKYSFAMLFYQQEKKSEFEEPVALINVFPGMVNRGYKSDIFTVESVNGIKISNFAQFVNVISNSGAKYIIIDFIEKNRIILDRLKAIKSFKEIQKVYEIAQDRRL